MSVTEYEDAFSFFLIFSLHSIYFPFFSFIHISSLFNFTTYFILPKLFSSWSSFYFLIVILFLFLYLLTYLLIFYLHFPIFILPSIFIDFLISLLASFCFCLFLPLSYMISFLAFFFPSFSLVLFLSFVASIISVEDRILRTLLLRPRTRTYTRKENPHLSVRISCPTDFLIQQHKLC